MRLDISRNHVAAGRRAISWKVRAVDVYCAFFLRSLSGVLQKRGYYSGRRMRSVVRVVRVIAFSFDVPIGDTE